MHHRCRCTILCSSLVSVEDKFHAYLIELLVVCVMAAMNEENIDFLQNLISRILHKSNHTTEIKAGSSKGDGYLSCIYRIKITDKNNKNDTNCFIAKVATKDEETRKSMSIRSFFIAETYFYENIFPIFLDFQKKKNTIEFQHIEKCYTSHLKEKEETLIFEDLKASGYEMWNRRLLMSENLIVKILELYGRFHAISFALRDQEKKTFDALAEDSIDALKICSENYSEKTKQTFTEVFKSYLPYLEENASKIITEKFKEIIFNWATMMVDSGCKEDPQMVFCHGDTWSNNIMIKESSNDFDIRLIDFQIQRLCSPVFDVIYFFFTSATGQILQNFDDYMKIYYDSFSEFLQKLGSDPQKLYPHEDFRNHLKKYGKSALVLTIFVMKFLFVDGDEVPELQEDAIGGFDSEIQEKDRVEKRVKDVLDLAVAKGIL